MLMVRTYLAPSAIEGLGVFAGEFIGGGRLVWSLNPLFDIFIRESEIERLPQHMQDFIDRYSWTYREMPGVVMSGERLRQVHEPLAHAEHRLPRL